MRKRMGNENETEKEPDTDNEKEKLRPTSPGMPKEDLK